MKAMYTVTCCLAAAMLLTAVAAKEPPQRPTSAPAATTAPAQDPPPTEVLEKTGTTPASAYRPIAPTKDAELAALLKRFEHKPEAFEWRMQFVGKGKGFRLQKVSFPSPYTSPVEVNNTIHCEYYLTDRGKAPGVIVLHILDGSFTVARVLCHRLASGGVNALLMKMPYYGPRSPSDRKYLEGELRKNPKLFVDAVTQAAMDVRRSAAWLSGRPEVDPERVGVCGVSLGGFAAALAGGVDGNFPRVAIVLAGGDLPKMIIGATSREVGPIWREFQRQKWTPQQVREILRPIDPLTYAKRLKGSKPIMLNATRDTIVPPACAKALREASGAEITWYRANHYSMGFYLVAAGEKLLEHFSAEKW